MLIQYITYNMSVLTKYLGAEQERLKAVIRQPVIDISKTVEELRTELIIARAQVRYGYLASHDLLDEPIKPLSQEVLVNDPISLNLDQINSNTRRLREIVAAKNKSNSGIEGHL